MVGYSDRAGVSGLPPTSRLAAVHWANPLRTHTVSAFCATGRLYPVLTNTGAAGKTGKESGLRDVNCDESRNSSHVLSHLEGSESPEDATLVYGSPGISQDERTLWQTRRKAPKAARRAIQKRLKKEPAKRPRLRLWSRKPRANPRPRS